jgi:hypothetical protein
MSRPAPVVGPANRPGLKGVGQQAICEHFIGKLFGLLARPQHRFENRRGRQDLPTPEFIDDDACHLAGVDDGLRDWDREGDNVTERVGGQKS